MATGVEHLIGVGQFCEAINVWDEIERAGIRDCEFGTIEAISVRPGEGASTRRRVRVET